MMTFTDSSPADIRAACAAAAGAAPTWAATPIARLNGQLDIAARGQA